MYTPLIWHFHGTAKANPKSFLDAIEGWLTSDERKTNYGFEFKKPLSELYPNELPFFDKSAEGHAEEKNSNKSTIEILTAEEDGECFVSMKLERNTGNSTWIVEAGYSHKIAYPDSSRFVIKFGKSVIDTAKPSDHHDLFRSPPKLPSILIEEGLASKEATEDFTGPLAPLTDTQFSVLRSLKLPHYPLLTLNMSEGEDYPSLEVLQLLLGTFGTMVHIRTVSDSAKKWAFRIDYPRLKYTAEYYSHANYPRKSEKDKPSFAESGTPARREASTFPLTKFQLRHKPHTLITDFTMLIGEGLGHILEIDHERVSKMLERSLASRRIAVTEELARLIIEARRLKGYTQGDLAKRISSLPDSSRSLNNLLISRIENVRLKRIEVTRLADIERALELPEGYFESVLNRTGIDALSAFVHKSEPTDTEESEVMAVTEASAGAAVNAESAVTVVAQPGAVTEESAVTEASAAHESVKREIRFCPYCGGEFPSPDANFCPYCGAKKASL